MNTARKSHALQIALRNLECGESIHSTEMYLCHTYPPKVAHEIAWLAAHVIDSDPDFERGEVLNY